MDYTTLVAESKEDQEQTAKGMQSLYEVCQQVVDGRLKRRQITTNPDLNDYLRRDWGEVGQVFRLQRERTIKGKHSVEVVYGWTSLSPNPTLLLSP